MTNSNVDEIGNTAFIIAQWRANETERNNPLYHDTLASIFLSDEFKKLATQISKVSSSTELLINLRTKFFDDTLVKQIENSTQQVVILGAGFDTRSIRLGESHVKFFEVDKKEVLQFKSQKLRSHGYSENSTYIACNYLDTDFISQMEGKGFDSTLDTFFLWEGNTMYLSVEDIIGLLKRIGLRMDRFRISFDYLSERLLRLDQRPKEGKLIDEFDNMGAPWRTGFDDIAEVADKADLKILKNSFVIDCVDGYHLEEYINDYSICTMTRKD